MGFTITSDQIIWLCAFVVGLWGVWKIVKEIRKPNDDLKATVARHDQLLADDNRRINDMQESNQMMLKSMLVIINHEITGNGLEKMKETRDELQEYLINR